MLNFSAFVYCDVHCRKVEAASLIVFPHFILPFNLRRLSLNPETQPMRLQVKTYANANKAPARVVSKNSRFFCSRSPCYNHVIYASASRTMTLTRHELERSRFENLFFLECRKMIVENRSLLALFLRIF